MFRVLCVMAAVLGGVAVAGEMPADVAAQVAKFKDKDPKVRQQAVAAVGRFGEKAKPALPAICEALTLEGQTVWVVTKALMAIAEIGPDDASAKASMPYLGREPDFRTLAVDVYVKMGEKAVPHLKEALKNDALAEGVCEAALALGGKAKELKPELTAVSTKHKSQPVRDKAVKALKAIAK